MNERLLKVVGALFVASACSAGKKGQHDPGPMTDRIETTYQVALPEGMSDVIELAVPENTLSIGVTVGDGLSNRSFAVCEWIGPGNETIVSPNWLDYTYDLRCLASCVQPGCDPRSLCSNPVRYDGPVGTAVLPSGPNITPRAGTHRLRVCSRELNRELVPVNVVLRLGAEPTSGVLDLNLHFTGSRGWTADTAPEDAQFQQLLQDVGAIYGAIGVELNIQTWSDVTSQRTVSALEPSDVLDAVPSETPRGINIVFVDGFEEPGVLGVGSGIPTAFVGPTKGLVVGVGAVDLDFSTLDTVVAHELGHTLGLFHTGEQGSVGGEDVFTDTIAGDERMLMFYGNGGGTRISPQQRQVILRSPHLRSP